MKKIKKKKTPSKKLKKARGGASNGMIPERLINGPTSHFVGQSGHLTPNWEEKLRRLEEKN